MAGRRIVQINQMDLSKLAKDILLFILALAVAAGLFMGLREGYIKDSDQINILMMGIDSASDLHARSDSINILHIDFLANRIGVLSIPRDTFVDIPGHGQDKINHAHMFGGPELSMRTISKFLNIPVNYYVEVNFPMFVNMIDELGGITVDIEKPLYYQDNAANLHINLQPGIQHLSGYQAMGFVRFRHDSTSDWGRIERQHKFFIALAGELFSFKNILRMPSILAGASSGVRTNISGIMALKLAVKLPGLYRTGKVVMGVIPGGDMRLSRGYYMMSDPKGKTEAIERVIYGR